MAGKTSDQTTGRTPWDFATEVLKHLGPTTVIVIGLLGSAYYLYTQIDEARLNASKRLQDSLASAQAQLVDNTQKMGEMSEKLIENIDSMLVLSKRVDLEIDTSRERYKKQLQTIRSEVDSSAEALRESQQQVETARTEIQRLTEDLKKKHTDISNLEETHKKLSVEVADLKEQKETLQGNTQEYARQVGELKEKQPATTLGDIVDRVKADDSAMATVRGLLTEFAADPKSDEGQKVAESLIGLRSEILEKVIKEDGADFQSWFYIENLKTRSKSLFGYVKSNPEGPENLLVVGIAKDRVFLASALAENFLFKINTAENWYENWIGDIAINYDGEVIAGYNDLDIDRWDQLSISGAMLPRGTFKSGPLFGKVPVFDLTTKDAFKQKFPGQFDSWSQKNDAYGRPGLILSMMDRAMSFEAAEIDGMSQAEFPDGLRDFAVAVLNASVADNSLFLKNVVGRYVSRDDLGAVAAMALRDGIRVEQVVERQTAMQQAPAPEEFEVRFSLDAIASAKERDQAKVTFSRTAGGWRLSDVTAPF